MLQVSYLFDDVGIPADFRHINGSSVHTYSLISSSGKVTFVKFHWLPTLGGHMDSTKCIKYHIRISSVSPLARDLGSYVDVLLD